MASDYLSGNHAIDLIAEAFGLHRGTQRVVIDMECGSVARIIRVDTLTKQQADVLIESLKQCNAEVV